MKLNSVRVCCALALAVTAAACQKSSPSQPSAATTGTTATTSVTDAVTGITLTTPLLSVPADGTRAKFADQPLTLTVKNAVSTGTAALTYTFQVATDTAFASIVYSKDGVPQGSGSTSLQIDKLAGAKDYYWRARVTSGSSVGLLSKPKTFNVGPEVVIQTPSLLNPQNNSVANGQSPTLTTTNATVTGPAGTINYKFDVSDSSSFTNIVYTGTVTQQDGQTSLTIPTTVKLTAGGVYFWRVQASDASSGVTSAYSNVFSFKFVPFDMRTAIIHNSPPDVAQWDVSAHVTSVHFTGDAFEVDFDRRTGPNAWIDLDFGDGNGGTLQYTLGMCLNISGQFHCSAVVQFWTGRDLDASTPPSYVGQNWFYDPVRWGAMAGYQPQDNESVGIWAGHGNLRGKDYTLATCPQICDRTDVVFVSWQNEADSLQLFGVGSKTLAIKRTGK